MKRVMVVDDSPAILDSVELMLNFEGFEVHKFEKGSEMLNKLEAAEKPDAILLDMWLSGEDGRDICRMIKKDEKLKDIPVVIMSASRGLAATALEAGADEFIPKPFDLGQMLNVINTFVKQKK